MVANLGQRQLAIVVRVAGHRLGAVCPGRASLVLALPAVWRRLLGEHALHLDDMGLELGFDLVVNVGLAARLGAEQEVLLGRGINVAVVPNVDGRSRDALVRELRSIVIAQVSPQGFAR